MKINKILVSQPQGAEAQKYYNDIAQKYNVQIDFKQFIHIESVTPKEFRAQRVSILPEHTAVIFTSRHAIDHFFNLCQEMRVDIPETMKYFCVSETISLYIQKYVQYRKRKVFFGTSGRFDSLLPLIIKHRDERYLVPMSSIHTDDIKNILDANDIQHDEVVMYRTVSTLFGPGEIDDYDMMVFFSPAGIDSLLENKPEFEQGNLLLGCFGPASANAVRAKGLRLDLEAPTEKAPSMTMALDQFLAQAAKEEKAAKAKEARAAKAKEAAAKAKATTATKTKATAKGKETTAKASTKAKATATKATAAKTTATKTAAKASTKAKATTAKTTAKATTKPKAPTAVKADTKES